MLEDKDIITHPVRTGEEALADHHFENQADRHAAPNLERAAQQVLGTLDGTDSLLSRLLAPISLEDFLGSHWQRRPLHIQNEHKQRMFAELYTRDMLETGISDGVYDREYFRFVDSGGYRANQQFAPTDDTGSLDPEKVRAFFEEEGGSVVVDHVHRYHPKLNAIWQAVAASFGFPVTCTAYFTPSGGQTFPTHWDTDDVLIVQLSGSKRWTVYEPVVRDTLEHQRWEQYEYDLGKELVDLTIRPGDLLYVPRGFPHRVRAGADEASLHLTLGVCIPTWHMSLKLMLEDLLLQCGREMAFRQPCPAVMGRERSARPEAAAADEQYFSRLKESLLRKLTTDELRDSVERFMTRHVRSATLLPEDDDTAAAPARELALSLDAHVHRPERICFLRCEGAQVHLKFEGKVMSFPRAAESALRWMLTRSSFCTGELPGPLSGQEHLLLVTRLLDEQFLTRPSM